MFGRLLQRLSSRVSRSTMRPVIVPATARPRPQLQPSDVYTPTQPRTTRSMFIGRHNEIEAIVQGLIEDRAHIVLYSERGRGKTSLANIIVEALRRNGLIVVRTQCDASSTCDSFMRGLLRNVPASLLKSPNPDRPEGCESALPATPVRPDDITAVLSKLRVRTLICVVDEFDRLTDAASRTMLADTIKQISDRGLPLLFMIIGVSDSLEQLIGQHPSIQRNLLAVPLPLMSDENVAAIIQTGAREAHLTFPPALVSNVTAIARGMPYVAQLLGLRIAQAAGRRGSNRIEQRDLAAAISRLIAETPPLVVQHYSDLTANGVDVAMAAALDGVARCSQDIWGHIPLAVSDSASVLVGGVRITYACWSRLQEVCVLRPCHGKPGYLAYADWPLIQYVLLRGSQTRGSSQDIQLAAATASSLSNSMVRYS